MISINIGKEFSRVPSGRTQLDGPDSGERFRDRFLLPPLRHGESLSVEIDDAIGYQSSFLEEAFGPLAELLKIPGRELAQRIKVVSEKPRFQVFARLIEKFVEEGRG